MEYETLKFGLLILTDISFHIYWYHFVQIKKETTISWEYKTGNNIVCQKTSQKKALELSSWTLFCQI